jgi:hypothetical protein
MVSKSISLFLLLLLFNGCGTLGEEDVIDTKTLTQIDNETFIYKVYKIDFDAFVIKFKVVAHKDTSDIFEIYIADGVYSENSFNSRISNDTIIISDPRQSETFFYRTKKGTTIKHTKTLPGP